MGGECRMKAWVLHDVNDLRLEEVPVPEPAGKEVLVKVKAAGICGSDIPRIYRTGAHAHPLIPGHEFSGEVVEAGAGVDKSLLGRRVGIFPLIPCRSCSFCRKKQYELCRNYSYLGSRRDGGFGKYAAVPVWNLIALPDKASYEEAAMLEPMAVAVHAMRRVRINGEDRAAVCGLGTIGLLLVMFLREAGVKNLFVVGNKDSQRRAAERIGLSQDQYCDTRDPELGRRLLDCTGGLGADVFFECVGKNETYDLAVESLATGGRLVAVGNPASDMLLSKDRYWKILRSQLTVTGTWNSSFTHEPGDDWRYVLDRLSEGKIAPAELISHRVSLEDLRRGLEIMRDKTEDYEKVMGVMEVSGDDR